MVISLQPWSSLFATLPPARADLTGNAAHLFGHARHVLSSNPRVNGRVEAALDLPQRNRAVLLAGAATEAVRLTASAYFR